MSLRRLPVFLVLALACMAGSLPVHATNPPVRAEERWLLASDIHLDPFNTASKPVYYNEDSNIALLDTTIAAMRRAEPNPPVILLTGDFLAHHFGKLAEQHHKKAIDAALATMQTIAQRFNRAFPHARFILVYGNNDDPCGDYAATNDSPYLHRLAHIWAPLVNRGGAAPNFVTAFGHGAYYTEAYGKLRFVVLDSVYWSFRYKNACAKIPSDPGTAEFTWLQTQLSAKDGERNVVIMHIPPGVDAGSTAVVHGIAAVPFLNGKANAMLTQLLSDPANTIATVIAGHTHHTEFRTFGNVPMLIAASISPIYGNSPTFFALRISPDTGVIRDFDAYMYRYGNGDPHQEVGAPGWQRVFNYNKTFGVTSANAAAFHTIHDHFNTGWRPNPAAEFESNRYSLCAQDELSTTYATCSGIRRHEWFLASIAAAVIVVIVIILLIRRRMKPQQG